MKLTVLGSGTSVFHPQRASAAFWLETDAGSLLLDCSGDAPHRMAEENLDWSNLDAIWISHMHLDHCAGLAPFLFGIKRAPEAQHRTKPLQIFGCEGIETILRTIAGSCNYKLFEQKFPIAFHEVAASDEPISVEIFPDFTVECVATPHRAESL